jgi:isoquinoline 1-oxidoreductase subunit alpha
LPQIKINGVSHTIDADPQMPLLWAIRDVIGLIGTKFGCGVGACGACTVHMDGQAVRSCLTTLSDAQGH